MVALVIACAIIWWTIPDAFVQEVPLLRTRFLQGVEFVVAQEAQRRSTLQGVNQGCIFF